MSLEGRSWPWQFAIHAYTAPLSVLAGSNWSSRAEYIYRLTGDRELSDRIGRRIYAKMYPTLVKRFPPHVPLTLPPSTS